MASFSNFKCKVTQLRTGITGKLTANKPCPTTDDFLKNQIPGTNMQMEIPIESNDEFYAENQTCKAKPDVGETGLQVFLQLEEKLKKEGFNFTK